MGKDTTLNKHQIDLLDRISQNEHLSSLFYFTGGTALSEIYLQHRESIDLDFFSFKSYDPQTILSRLEKWKDKLNFTFTTRYVDPTHIYFLTFADGDTLKIDFAHYPYKHLQTPKIYKNKLSVDSELDIAVNKLLTTTQRTEVKDFVDLYFLMQKFTFWDLHDGVKTKFNIDIEPFIFASDCIVVEEFEFLPKMIKPLTLDTLQSFFRELAQKLGRESVE